MKTFFDGKKTYIGIIVIIAGLLGYGDILTPDTLDPIADSAFQVVGIIIAIYGRMVAKV